MTCTDVGRRLLVITIASIDDVNRCDESYGRKKKIFVGIVGGGSSAWVVVVHAIILDDLDSKRLVSIDSVLS